MSNKKNAKIMVWEGKLLVEYNDCLGGESSFVVENEDDIKELIKELEFADYVKKIYLKENKKPKKLVG